MIGMVTTIQVSGDLLEKLKGLKISAMESYENVIWNLVEDSMELSKETKEAIEAYESDVREGMLETFSHEEVKRSLGICTN